MKKKVLIFVLVAICSFSVFAQNKTKKEKICITEPEFEVYEAVGVGDYQNETISFPFSEHLESQFPNISPEVVADFYEKNRKVYFLRCLLKKDQEKKKLKTFYSRTTFMNFSRVGFNKDETQALVYVSWSAAGNQCESDFFHLKKENDKWTIVKKVMTVIC